MIKGIFGDKEFKRDRNKIYIDEVRTPDDIDVIIELSKLKDKDSLNFYKKMEDDFNYIYNKNLINMNDKNDKCNFACFFVNNEKYQFFIIKLGEKVIGELYTYESAGGTYFNILLKPENRNKGYGKKAIDELKNVAFLYKMSLKNTQTLIFDTFKNLDDIGEFIIKCGFEIDAEFGSGTRRLKFTEEMYNSLILKDFNNVSKEQYEEYIVNNEDTKFPNTFSKFENLLNKDKNYNYLFWYKKNKIIGIGKYLKKNKLYKNCIWLEIHPKYRREGYGTMFLNNILLHLVDHKKFGLNYSTISIIIKFNDYISRRLIKKALSGFSCDEFYLKGNIIYIKELIHVDYF